MNAFSLSFENFKNTYSILFSLIVNKCFKWFLWWDVIREYWSYSRCNAFIVACGKNRAMVTSPPFLFIYLSLSLHLSVTLTQMHCQLFAFRASNICSAYCLCLFQTLQLHIAHGRLSSHSQIFFLSVSNLSFFFTLIIFLSYSLFSLIFMLLWNTSVKSY